MGIFWQKNWQKKRKIIEFTTFFLFFCFVLFFFPSKFHNKCQISHLKKKKKKRKKAAPNPTLGEETFVKLWGLLLQYYWVGILLASC